MIADEVYLRGEFDTSSYFVGGGGDNGVFADFVDRAHDVSGELDEYWPIGVR